MVNLSKKCFIEKFFSLSANVDFSGAYIAANRNITGLHLGWIVGYSDDYNQYTLVTAKRLLRNFRTLDAAIEFVSENNLGDLGSVNVSFA